MGPRSLQGQECVCVCISNYSVITVVWKKRWVFFYFACVLICFSCVQLSATPQTVAPQAPLSMGFSMQEYWSGLPCPPPGDLPDPDRLYTWPIVHLTDCTLTILLMFSHSVVSDSLWPHGLQHARLPCPSASPWVYPSSCPLNPPSNINYTSIKKYIYIYIF